MIGSGLGLGHGQGSSAAGLGLRLRLGLGLGLGKQTLARCLNSMVVHSWSLNRQYAFKIKKSCVSIPTIRHKTRQDKGLALGLGLGLGLERARQKTKQEYEKKESLSLSWVVVDVLAFVFETS